MQGQFEVRRFRPNIVVRPENDDAGFVESKWVGRELRIGDDVVLAITDHCGATQSCCFRSVMSPAEAIACLLHAHQFVNLITSVYVR